VAPRKSDNRAERLARLEQQLQQLRVDRDRTSDPGAEPRRAAKVPPDQTRTERFLQHKKR
jgi:hypothetical protein